MGWFTSIFILLSLLKFIDIAGSFIKVLLLQNHARLISIYNPRYFKQHEIIEFLIHECCILSHEILVFALLSLRAIRFRAEINEMASQHAKSPLRGFRLRLQQVRQISTAAQRFWITFITRPV